MTTLTSRSNECTTYYAVQHVVGYNVKARADGIELDGTGELSKRKHNQTTMDHSNIFSTCCWSRGRGPKRH